MLVSISLLLIVLLAAFVQAEPPSERLKAAKEAANVETERNVASCRSRNSIPDDLLALPCVKKVKVIEPKQAAQTIVHLRDWHFLPRDVFDADLQSVNDEQVSDDELDELYDDFLLKVERVQAEQMAILRCLIRHHGLRRVFSEGLTKRDMPIFKAKIRVMKKLEDELPGYREDLAEARRRLKELEKEDQVDSDEYRINEKLADEIEGLFHQHRLDLLRVGAAGRLFMADELAEVVPIEDDAPFEAANPIGKDGTVTLDSEKNKRREDAQVRNLLKAGPLVVVILGGSHDLSDNIIRLAEERCRYAAVTTRGFEGVAGESR